MLIVYILLLFSFFFLPPAKHINKVVNGGVSFDYLSPQNALAIKGAFTFIVMCSHSRDYLTLSNGFLDQSFNTITNMIGQLMVAPFFFYSGYGIFESVKKKRGYIQEFPKRRLLPTWLSFAICIVLYFFFNLLRKKRYDVRTILFAFIGWESIGNSNWFMFVTFALYVLFYIAFRIKKENYKSGLIFFSMLSLALFVYLYYTKQSYWCNTLFCFSAGMWYSFLKNKIDYYVSENRNYWTAVFFTFFLFLVLYYIAFWKDVSLPFSIFRPFLFGLCAIMFCILIILFTVKIQIRSSFCIFLGKHVFSIYILQRIFFISLQPIIANRYLLFCCAGFLTIIAATLYDVFFAELKRRIL